MVIVLSMALESFQYLTLLFSDWHKVKMLCRYVRDASWHNHPWWERMLRLMCRVRLIRYWNNSVGQYSLLLACLPSSQQRIWRQLPLPQWITGFLIRSRMTTHRRLPDEVKRAIYQFLRHGLTRLQHGEYALEKNGVLLDDLRFYPRKETSTAVQRILIWHIATEVYDSQWQQQQLLPPPRRRPCVDSAADGVDDDRLVATTLSAYCAYLVSSAPELLPDHSYNTRLLFDGVQCEAREALQCCRSREDVYDKLPLHPDPRSSNGGLHKDILPEARRLSQLLRQMPDTWKLLAELWVELLLSVAPSSDNVVGHVQKLADGGELITHLWALLTHAGIIEKCTTAESNAFPV